MINPAKANGLHSITFGRALIEFRVQHSQRKTLAITVQPSGAVIVTAPLRVDHEAIRAKVRKRSRWILAQRDYFSRFLPATPPRRYVSGETHRYLGRQYRLKVSVQPRSEIKLLGRFLCVSTKTKRRKNVRAMLEEWFRHRAKEQFERRLERWHAWCNARGMKVPELRLRKMAKRWGSSTSNSRIYLNPDLVRAPSACIDYVIAHEVCHLKFPHHDKAFYRLLAQVFPNWRKVKEQLEESLT
jgi:predicted metal-dependent hydrolase